MLLESPESRLLNLIKRKPKKKSPISRDKSWGEKLSLSRFIKIFFLRNKIFNPLFLKSVNKFLLLILLFLFSYFLLSFFFPLGRDMNFSILKEGEISTPVETEPQEVEIFRPEDFSIYLKKIKGKQLFAPDFSEEKLQIESEIDISKKFNLVGIISGERPQAIIEDKETHKTYYLYAGQSFSGVTVEEIGEGKVVLNYQGRKVELIL